MNSNQKSDLDIQEAELGQFSENSLLEVMQEKTGDGQNSKYVLIKHDYYSSDSDHGRDILSGFISALADSSFSSIVIYLIDSGTLLLDRNNPLFSDMSQLLKKSEMVIAVSESIEEYGISIESDPKIVIQSARSVAEDLIYIPDLLILE